MRDGVRHEIPAEELVPGDIVLIEAGDRIPADIRLCEVRQLLVNEASLTGESEPAAKIAETLPEEKTVLGERVNMVFMGTMAVGGYASGVVVATGMATEMGRVAHLIQDAEMKILLCKKIRAVRTLPGNRLLVNMCAGCDDGQLRDCLPTICLWPVFLWR